MKKLLKKQISKLVSILVLTLSTTSCNYLDVIPDNIPTIDMAFADRAAAEKYLFTCYSYLPNFYHPDNDPAMLEVAKYIYLTEEALTALIWD